MAVRRKKVAVIHCNGRPTRKEGFEQVTVTGNCQEILTQYSEGINICSYGCLGGGSCVEACRLHAVSIGERGMWALCKSLPTASDSGSSNRKYHSATVC